MKVELHLHTSRYSGCATHSPQEAMRRLIETGYDAVFITEHDAVWSADDLRELRMEFLPRLRILPGVELSTGEGSAQHILVLGTDDPSYLGMLDDQAVIRKARAAGHLTVLAHPFRWDKAATVLSRPLLPDAMEYRTGNHDPSQAQEALRASRLHGLPLVNTGDVHSLEMIDRFWIETRVPVVEGGDIRRIILEGLFENRSGRQD